MATDDPIRIIKHEAVAKTGSFEVQYSDGRPSKFFYWEDVPGRRLRPEQVDSGTALEQAKAFARAERDKQRWQLAPRSLPRRFSVRDHGPGKRTPAA